ncbi:MAG TPA: hypothetical protein VIN40_00020 [Candidatus Tyrphobacter sp.]
MLHAADENALRLALSLEIAEDAERASVDFWKVWLWSSQERRSRPTRALCARLADRFGVSAGEVYRQWLEWYGLLTSWELAAALTGRDVRVVSVVYGRSHRRT